MQVGKLIELLEREDPAAEVRVSTAGHDFEVPKRVHETPNHKRVVIYTEPI